MATITTSGSIRPTRHRMIQGNDGGASVSLQRRLTWSSIYNQPTAQFYRIDIDNRYPYSVYGTQQDNTSIAVPSATQWGAITLGDCIYPGTGESGFIAVHPDDPNIVYCGADRLQPRRRRRAAALRPPDRPDPARQRLARGIDRHRAERHAISLRLDLPDRVLAARQRRALCRRQPRLPHQRRGHELGGDLSRSQPERHLAPGSTRAAPITRESAGAEVHATCACVAESPHRKGEIWASTDDGLVHVTRDDGASWQNVTPPEMPELAYVGCVEISPHDPDTIYVAATRYKLADYKPYLFRSATAARPGNPSAATFPPTEITRVVRADPVAAGTAVRRDRDRHLLQPRRRTARWTRMPGGLPGRSGLRPEDQRHRSGRRHAWPLVLDPR